MATSSIALVTTQPSQAHWANAVQGITGSSTAGAYLRGIEQRLTREAVDPPSSRPLTDPFFLYHLASTGLPQAVSHAAQLVAWATVPGQGRVVGYLSPTATVANAMDGVAFQIGYRFGAGMRPIEHQAPSDPRVVRCWRAMNGVLRSCHLAQLACGEDMTCARALAFSAMRDTLDCLQGAIELAQQLDLCPSASLWLADIERRIDELNSNCKKR